VVTARWRSGLLETYLSCISFPVLVGLLSSPSRPRSPHFFGWVWLFRLYPGDGESIFITGKTPQFAVFFSSPFDWSDAFTLVSRSRFWVVREFFLFRGPIAPAPLLGFFAPCLLWWVKELIALPSAGDDRDLLLLGDGAAHSREI